MYSGYVESIAHHNDFDEGMLDDAQIIDTTLLPPEYMPLYYSPNPWNKFATIEEDFIVIAEFSELVGPKPLICIPNNSSRNDGFDLNAFVLKIMSVDHQSMTTKFSMPQDAQVVLDESKDGVYAYVHHFTLHDSQARGFVRPFCMAYVTPDSRKIMTFYEDIERLFRQVSKYFKYGNLKLFYKDMKHYVADLEFTKAKLQEFKKQPKKPPDEMTEEEKILEETCDRSIDNIIPEIRDIIDIVQPLLNEDQRMSKKFKGIEERAFLKESRSQKKNATLVESSSLDGDSSAQRSYHTKAKMKRSSSFNVDNADVSMEDYTSYKPQLVKPHKRRFDEDLRTLHELSLWGAKEGINGLRNILRYFRRDTATLLIEKKDSELMDPPSCLLTIGQCVTVNFLFNCENRESTSNWGLKDPSSDRMGSSPEKLSRWLSTDTLESFKSAESFFSVKDDCDIVRSEQSSYEPTFVAAGNPCSELRNNLCDDSLSFDIVSTPSDDEIFVEASSSFTNQQDLNEAIKAAAGKQAHEIPCDEDPGPGVSDSASSDNYQHMGKKIKIPVISPAEHVNNLEPTAPGYGILKFINTHSYSHHLFASMLMGRPVVVMGKSEKDVKDALTTLSLFVPGYSSRRKTVVLSQNQPLKITDLAKLTLIGLVKPEKKSAEYLVPESIKRYVTMLDLDKKILISPEYEGGVLRKVLKQKKVFLSDEAYLAFIHGVLLFLASKAFLLYHWMVKEALIGLSDSSEQVPSLGSQSLAELIMMYDQNRENDKRLVEYLTDLGVENGDIPIVKYFAEIIQMQQSDEFYTDKMTGLPDKPAPSVRLDYRQTNVFKS